MSHSTANRFQRLRKLFDAARAWPTSARSAFLAGLTGADAALGDEVWAMLDVAGHESRSLVDGPRAAFAAAKAQFVADLANANSDDAIADALAAQEDRHPGHGPLLQVWFRHVSRSIGGWG